MAPQQCTTLRSAPAYTFGSRAAPPAYAEQVPAPNTYQPRLTSSNFASPKGAGFGTSGRLAPYGNKNPAPGDYTPQDRLLRSSSPQFTFKGVAAKDHKVLTPAPGQYSPERCSAAASSHPCAPAVSISRRLPPPKSHSRQPAPGEYEVAGPHLARGKGLPVTMKFRHERTVTRVTATPGPGEYKVR